MLERDDTRGGGATPPEQEAATLGHHRSEALLDTFPGLVYRMVDDPQWTTEYASAGCAALTGWTPADLMAGRPTYEQLIHPDDRARVRAETHRALDEGRTYELRYRLVRRDGATREVWEHGRALSAGRGGPRVLEGFVQDVTERVRAEEQLRQAAKMEAVGRLAGGIAHDFNNLLTVISGSTEFLLEACPPGDPRHDDVLDVRRAAERARDLTRQLLSFSRRQPVQPTRVRLDRFVDDAARLLQRVVGEGTRIETVHEAGTPAVRADRGQLEQTLVNLVVNARDAMPGGGTITIRTLPAEDGGAALAVRDTGVGMDAETRTRAFEPFFTTKGQGKGTGIGLSTVFAIVHQAGGRVQIDSAPGAGSTFTVLLPPDPMPDAGADDAAPAAAAPLAGGAETVLVVEDDPRVRRLACRALESRGYRVLEAGSGDEAVAVADAHAGTLHLVMSDAVLPEGNGRQVVAAIAARRPGVRALLMSGYSADTLPDPAMRALPLLEKPFTVDRLLAAVRDALDGGGGGGAGAARR